MLTTCAIKISLNLGNEIIIYEEELQLENDFSDNLTFWDEMGWGGKLFLNGHLKIILQFKVFFNFVC